MEKIKLTKIDKKVSGLVIIGFTDSEGFNPGEATMHTKWQSQDVDYMEKDVGIGGTVKVEIVQKGEYTNIKTVDMKSGVKGLITESEKVSPDKDWKGQVDRLFSDVEPIKSGLMSQKDIMIISQCLTKAWVKTAPIGTSPGKVLEAYRFFVLELEQNG